jgi:hypothetical protein
MESKMYGMKSIKKSQAFDIGLDGVFKILFEKSLLQFMKNAPALDALSCFFKDNDSPYARFDPVGPLSQELSGIFLRQQTRAWVLRRSLADNQA